MSFVVVRMLDVLENRANRSRAAIFGRLISTTAL